MAFQTRHPSGPSIRQEPPSFSCAFLKIYNGSASELSTSLAPTASNLFTRFPLLKFYRGFAVTILGMTPLAGMSFLTWGFLRSHFIHRPAPSSTSDGLQSRTKATPVPDLCIGAVSGALAQTVAYPFEIVRR